MSYAPLELAAVMGECPLVATPGDGGGDGFWCQQAASMQLSVAVAGDAGEPTLLRGGEAAQVAVEGGSYTVDVQKVLHAVDCSTDPVTPMSDIYAFAIAWHAG